MRWIGNKYVDADGRVVAVAFQETKTHTEGLFVASGVLAAAGEFIGGYISEADAMRAVERWWEALQAEAENLKAVEVSKREFKAHFEGKLI